MSDEHAITELRCEILDLEEKNEILRKTLKSIWADVPGIYWRRNHPEALKLITDAEVEAYYSD